MHQKKIILKMDGISKCELGIIKIYFYEFIMVKLAYR